MLLRSTDMLHLLSSTLSPTSGAYQSRAPTAGAHRSCVRLLLRSHLDHPVRGYVVPSIRHHLAYPVLHRAHLLQQKGMSYHIFTVVKSRISLI